MLKTCLVLAGLLVAPLMVWLLLPAAVCFVALCVVLLPFLPLLIGARQLQQAQGPNRKRGLPARQASISAPASLRA